MLVVVFSVMLVTGCDEEASNERMAKLIANENRQLKKQLEQRDREIQKQKQLLEKCGQEKKALQEQTKKNIQEQVQDVLGVVMEQNAKMRQEIEALKNELEELKNPKGSQPLQPAN